MQAVSEGKDPTLFVVVFEDSAALLGLVVALAGLALTQVTGNPAFDGIASMVIGMILGATAVWLAYETKSLLIGESASSRLTGEIRAVVGVHPLIGELNEAATLHMGPEFVLVTLSVDFVDNIDAAAIEAATSELTQSIKRLDNRIKRVFIEAQRTADHRREQTDALQDPA